MSSLPYRPRSSLASISPTTSGGVAGGKFVAVGIDFGTTYCGVSWAFSENPGDIHEITEWPSEFHLNAGEDQVPTQLDLATGKWGYEVTPQMKPIKWFKLLLLKDQDIIRDEIRNSRPLKDAQQQIKARGMTPTEVVGLYLKKLWAHTYKKLGEMLVIDSLPLRVAITVPAIWPPYAEQAMREAAKIAGITVDRDIGATTLDLIQEPEAAGLSIFLDRRDFPEIQPGESFVVCDAGGGTVDVISYTVKSLSPFRIGECVRGDGKLSGAFKVDEAFAAYLKWEIKLKLDSLDTAEHNLFVTKDWEMGAKRSFTGNPQPPRFFLTPPTKAFGKMDRLRGRGSFSISREAMAGFFDQSLVGIRSLLTEQIRGVEEQTGRKPKKILLVGGLGGSQYIYNQLDREYDSNPSELAKPKEKAILRPLDKAWSAVARGAVIRLLQDKMSMQSNLTPGQHRVISRIPEVITRKARYSYGILSEAAVATLGDFDPTLDRVTKNPVKVEVTRRMDWYLKKGDEVSKKEPVLLRYHQFAKKQTAQSKCVFVIQYSQSDIPPKRKDESVSELCRIECEWDKPFEQWKAVGNPADGWRKYDEMSLAMRFGGQPKWTIQVGSNQAEHDVKVEYQS
ncbi:hypothetical protein B0T21DRAFT_446196 [Apiosordaria backusii]|uniref:Uncharacterized protein n=1 Tax=Apiosordaria backusii TaxID=314023 RepID=A0AA40K607_9PEZI|nr:hypothetical protein B0T21DRAFT_446196 [Apiosordaria backusii]